MKVLIFSTYFLPVVGGVQTCVLALAKGLAEQGAAEESSARIEVTLATATPRGGMDDARLPFPVVRCPTRMQLRKLIRESDVVHIAGPSLLPMALAWFSAKPFFVEHHVYQAVCPNGLLLLQPEKTLCPGYFSAAKYHRCFQCRTAEVGAFAAFRSVLLGFPRRWLCKRATGNIAVTNHVKSRIAFPRSQTVYHGIETAGPPSASVALPSPSAVSPIQIAFVGRFVPEKGIPVLLHAAQQLQQEGVAFHLSLVGDGPQRASLESISRELKIEGSVTFRGELRGGDLQEALRQVSVVAMPSVWEETAGLAAIEHMMRGGVVIAADIGGLSEVVGDAGLKFAPGDAAALAGCIRKLSREPSLAISLGAAARARARLLFSVKRMIDGHLALYRRSVKQRASSLRQGTLPDAS